MNPRYNPDLWPEPELESQRLIFGRRSRLFGTPTALQVSKFLQYDVLTPPDTAVNVSKFLQYDVLAPPDNAVSVSKFVQYVVLETYFSGVPLSFRLYPLIREFFDPEPDVRTKWAIPPHAPAIQVPQRLSIWITT